MKLKVISGISILTLLMNSNLFVYAQDNISNVLTNSNELLNKNLAKDVTIEGIEDNTIMYIGANIDIKAYVDSESTAKDIEWILNKDGIMDIISKGQEAKITAIRPGEVSVMARAMDGSDVSRSINIYTEEYSNDKSDIKLTQGIKPIKITGINTKRFQVESDQSMSNEEQIISIDRFLIETSKIGYLSVIDSYTYDDKYEIYKIKIDGIDTILELRVNKLNIDYYEKVIDLISNLNNHNHNHNDGDAIVPQEPDSTIEPRPPIEQDNPDDLNPPVDQIPPIVENIFPDSGLIVNKGDASIDNPIEVTIDRNISIDENKKYIKSYIDKLSAMGNLYMIDTSRDEWYTTYKFRLTILSDKRNTLIQNDFYIDIKINNDDVESYESIILMLDDDINENNKFSNEGNSENILDNNNGNHINNNDKNYLEEFNEGNKYSNEDLNIIQSGNIISQYNNDIQEKILEEKNDMKYNKLYEKEKIKDISNKNNNINTKSISSDISRVGIIGISLIGIIKIITTRKYI